MHWGYKTDAGPAAKNLNIHVKAVNIHTEATNTIQCDQGRDESIYNLAL